MDAMEKTRRRGGEDRLQRKQTAALGPPLWFVAGSRSEEQRKEQLPPL